MFRVSYIAEDNTIQQKQFDDTRQAWEWILGNPQITALKILVWDEYRECYSTLEEL